MKRCPSCDEPFSTGAVCKDCSDLLLNAWRRGLGTLVKEYERVVTNPCAGCGHDIGSHPEWFYKKNGPCQWHTRVMPKDTAPPWESCKCPRFTPVVPRRREAIEHTRKLGL